MGTLSACLSERVELEYHLESDATDPNIPDGRYCAPLQPRWDTPEFAALFAATLRTMALLQSSRGFYKKPSVRAQWNRDLNDFAQLKRSDVQAFQAEIAVASSGNLTALMAQAWDKGHTKIFKALKHIQMITANVPLTDGRAQSAS